MGGAQKVGFGLTLTIAACNLVRLRNLVGGAIRSCAGDEGLSGYRLGRGTGGALAGG